MGLSILGRALIVGATTFIMSNTGEVQAFTIIGRLSWNVSKWVPDGCYLPAKSSYMLWSSWKYIEIFNPSPKIEKFSSFLNVDDILWANSGGGRLWCQASWSRVFWPEMPAPIRIANFRKIKPFFNTSATKFAVGIYPSVSCWSTTCIFPHRAESPRILFGDWVELPIMHNVSGENERPLVCDQSFFGEKSLSACCAPECSCESGNHDCRERSDTAAMLVNKSAAALGIQSELDDENGWIFLGGSVVIAIGLPAYAFLESWRKRSFANHSPSQKENDQQ